jgi:hypothetical protein
MFLQRAQVQPEGLQECTQTKTLSFALNKFNPPHWFASVSLLPGAFIKVLGALAQPAMCQPPLLPNNT